MNHHTTVYSYGLKQIGEHLRVTNLARICGVDGPFGGFYYDHLMALKAVKKNVYIFKIWLAIVYAKDVLQ